MTDKECKAEFKDCVKYIRKEYGIIECIKFKFCAFITRHFANKK